MQSLAKILNQTAWQVLGKIVTSFSTIIILGLVARNYGEEGTGVFTLALTYLGIFYMLGDFGFNAHVLKRVKGKGESVREWRQLLGTRIMWSAVLVAVALGTIPFWPLDTSAFSVAVVLGGLAIIASAVYTTCNLIFQSKLRYDLSVLSSSLGTLFSLVFFIFLIALKLPVSYLLLAHLAGWFVIAVCALVLIRKLILSVVPIFDNQYTINLFKESWPIAATLSLNVLYFRVDAFLIAYFKSTSDVGIYNVAYSVFQSALVLPAFIMNAYYPIMLKSFDKIRLVGLGLFGLAVSGTIFTLFFSPLIIELLTGGGFSGSSESLRILSLGFPAYFLSSLLMWILITKNKYKSTFLLYTLGLILNLILNFIFIPKYSFLAASWITIISEYFILLLQVMVLWLGKSVVGKK